MSPASQAAYAAARAGVIMLTKCMALDGAADGIRVNAVAAGFGQTPMLERYLTAQEDPTASRAGTTALHPLARYSRRIHLHTDASVSGGGASDGAANVGRWARPEPASPVASQRRTKRGKSIDTEAWR